MKRIISWILVAVMLLSALPVLASAQTVAFNGYTIALGESIAVEFYTKAENVADFAKVVFYKNDVKAAEITSCPAAEADGNVYFKFSKLGPHEMDASIKAELYLTTSADPVDTKTISVLDYCTAKLAVGNNKLSKLIVDMLNYGVAAQAYKGNGTGVSEYVANLDEAITGLGTTGDAAVNALSTTVYERVESPAVSFTKAALVLNSGIVPSFTFTTEEDVSNLTAVVSCAGKTWKISNFMKEAAANTYTFDFYGMNPSQVRSWIFVSIQDAEGNSVSHTCAFTAEHYTAAAAEAEQALTNAMMHYGDSVKAYVMRDITTSVLTDGEKAALSALTVAQYEAAGVTNQGIVKWAYGEAGIDVSESFDKTVFNLIKAIFSGDAKNGRTPIASGTDGYVAKYSEMLVDGYYGGTEVKTQDKLFAAADFRVGDVFISWMYPNPANTNTKKYYAGIYLGDGKFLMSDNVSDSWEAAIDTETVFGSKLKDDMAIYCVLSPEQLAPKADGELTVQTQRKLSALTVADLDAAKKTNETGVFKWFCQQEGMKDAQVKNFSGIVTISNSLFNKTGTWTVKEGTTTYHKLFVEGYYGGIMFGAENSKTFTEADFKIGDIFFVQDKSSNVYVGLYQGDGVFLMYDKTNNKNGVDTEMAFGDLATAYNYYFVLRPSQYIYGAN